MITQGKLEIFLAMESQTDKNMVNILKPDILRLFQKLAMVLILHSLNTKISCKLLKILFRRLITYKNTPGSQIDLRC